MSCEIRFGACCVSGLLLLVGCAGDDIEKLPTYPVTAVVRMDGEAFGPCQVVLHPTGEGRSVIGPVDESGNVDFGTYESSDGAPAGDYKAVVQGTLSAAPPRPIPPVYSDPGKTPLRVTVQQGPNEVALDLDSKGAKSSGSKEDPFTAAMKSEEFGAGATQGD